MTMKSMPSEPCAQFSSRTSMPLCFRRAPMASYDFSSMLFPMAVCLLVLGPTSSWRALWCGWRLRESGSVRGKAKRGWARVFRGAPCARRKSFRGPCARVTVVESSLPRRDGVGRARRLPVGFRQRDCYEVLCVWASLGAWKRSCALADCCLPRWATGCSRGCRTMCRGYAHEVPGCFVSSWRARCDTWRSGLAITLYLVAGCEGHSAATLIVSTGGLPMRLSSPSGSEQGELYRQRIKKIASVHVQK